MAPNGPLPGSPNASIAPHSTKRKGTKLRSRGRRHPSTFGAAAPKGAKSNCEPGYYLAPLTAANLALTDTSDAIPVHGRNPVAQASGNQNSYTADNLSCASDITTSVAPIDIPASVAPIRTENEPTSPLEIQSTTATGPRITIRIPSLASRRALSQVKSGPPEGPSLLNSCRKRTRSPTPDAEEEEFAANFMRKRHVPAAMFFKS